MEVGPVALAAAFLLVWAVDVPWAATHGTDEPFPVTAFPMYAHSRGTAGDFGVLVVPTPEGNQTLDFARALSPDHEMLPGPARQSFEALRQSYLAGCDEVLQPRERDKADACTGEPGGLVVSAAMRKAWAEAAQERLGLDEPPANVTLALERWPFALEARRDQGPTLLPLFTVDLVTGRSSPAA